MFNSPLFLLRLCCGSSLFLLLACGPPPPPADIATVDTQPALSVVQEGVYDTAFFLQRITNLAYLAQQNPHEKMVLRSSYNANDSGDDADVYVDTVTIDNQQWHVLLDEPGPGCVVRLWANDRLNGQLRIYLDGEETPRFNANAPRFFDSSMPPFVEPFVFSSKTMQMNSYVSYFPVVFEKHCRIVSNSNHSGVKYQIAVRKLPTDQPCVTLPSTFDSLQSALKQASKEREQTATVKSGSRIPLMTVNGPAAIDYFDMQFSTFDPQVLKNIYIQMYWDSLAEPSVACSALDLFDSRGVKSSWNFYPVGHYRDENRPEWEYVYSRFYMPFRQKAQIFIENRSEVSVDVTMKIHLDNRPLHDDFLYFFAQAYERNLQAGMIYPYMNLVGKGNLVGFKLTSTATKTALPFFYLEGNNYIYIDGEPEPSLSDTGMNNFFNTGNVDNPSSLFYTQLFGCLGRSVDKSAFTVFYRFFMLDAIPFQSSLVWINEIGDPSKRDIFAAEGLPAVNYNWMCFWYSGQTDNIGQERQENLFHYVIDQNPDSTPDYTHPVLKGNSLLLHLPPGTWWLHSAPIWDLSRVSHNQYEVQ